MLYALLGLIINILGQVCCGYNVSDDFVHNVTTGAIAVVRWQLSCLQSGLSSQSQLVKIRTIIVSTYLYL